VTRLKKAFSDWEPSFTPDLQEPNLLF
jgi:hypothetical protein